MSERFNIILESSELERGLHVLHKANVVTLRASSANLLSLAGERLIILKTLLSEGES